MKQFYTSLIVSYIITPIHALRMFIDLILRYLTRF